MGKQKPYSSKMEKFNVIGRSRGARNLPINIFIKLRAVAPNLVLTAPYRALRSPTPTS